MVLMEQNILWRMSTKVLTTESVESFSVSDVIECGLEDKGVDHEDQAGEPRCNVTRTVRFRESLKPPTP
jgi:hypothetical protein